MCSTLKKACLQFCPFQSKHCETSVKYAKNTHCEKQVKYVILSSTMLCIHSNMMNNRCQKILALFALQCSDTSPMFGIHSSCQMNSYLHLVSILKERWTPRWDCLIIPIFFHVWIAQYITENCQHTFFSYLNKVVLPQFEGSLTKKKKKLKIFIVLV